MKKLFKLSFMLLIMLLFVLYKYPDNEVSQFVKHINSSSSFIIVLLTFAYVQTTGRQLNTMEKQIEIMEKQYNTQIQPILEPQIKKIELEKFRVFMSPEENFMKAKLLSRLFLDFTFCNIGNGAALNIVIFPMIKTKTHVIPTPTLRPDRAHCISEYINSSENIHITMFDNGIEIAAAIMKNEAILELNIFYKNVFGTGFRELIEYQLFTIDDESKSWKHFIKNDLRKYLLEIKKHDALKSVDTESASEIFGKMQFDLGEMFSRNLAVEYKVMPKSYNIEIVNYDESITAVDKEFEDLYKNYFEQGYDFMKEIKRKIG